MKLKVSYLVLLFSVCKTNYLLMAACGLKLMAAWDAKLMAAWDVKLMAAWDVK